MTFEERFRHRGPDRYVIPAAGFLVCQDCGCLIMEGHRDAHDHQHELIAVAWGVSNRPGKQTERLGALPAPESMADDDRG